MDLFIASRGYGRTYILEMIQLCDNIEKTIKAQDEDKRYYYILDDDNMSLINVEWEEFIEKALSNNYIGVLGADNETYITTNNELAKSLIQSITTITSRWNMFDDILDPISLIDEDLIDINMVFPSDHGKVCKKKYKSNSNYFNNNKIYARRKRSNKK